MIRWYAATSVATLSLLLTGCANVVTSPSSDTAAVNAPAAAYFPNIELNGRLSVRYQQNGKDEAVHGSFAWLQKSDRTVVKMMSPLGQTIAIIESAPGMSVLTQSRRPQRTAPNVDTLASEALGWPLPVAGLRDWLQGVGSDVNGKRFIATPQNGNDMITTRDGWRIRYEAWENGGGSQHPKRIDLERHTAQAGEVAIRIVIDEWHPL